MTCLSLFRLSCSNHVACVMLSFLLLWPNFGHAEEKRPHSAAGTVSTFEALPHVSLPQGGTVEIWCGQKEASNCEPAAMSGVVVAQPPCLGEEE